MMMGKVVPSPEQEKAARSIERRPEKQPYDHITCRQAPAENSRGSPKRCLKMNKDKWGKHSWDEH